MISSDAKQGTIAYELNYKVGRPKQSEKQAPRKTGFCHEESSKISMDFPSYVQTPELKKRGSIIREQIKLTEYRS